jgi:DME family drug/metabolite transporter
MVMVLVAAVMWGTTGTSRALGAPGAAPLAVGAVRIVIGGAILFALAAARGQLRRRWPALPAIASAAAVAAYQLAFFEGVARAGVAVGTILAIGSAPVFTGLLGWLALGDRPTPRWIVSTVIAVVGVALLAEPGGRGFGALAAALPFAAGLAYAIYATATKRLLAESEDHLAVAAIAFAGGAVLLLPVLAFADLAWLHEPRGLAAALWLGVVTTAVAYVIFTRALARLPVSWGATLSLAEPLTATLLGTLVLGESLAPSQLAGGVLVAAGLLALATAPRAS